MIYGYFTLLVALIISGIAEYYSIVGLTILFPSSFWPIVIMGASLGVGKITAAVWLKVNWNRAPFAYKLYLVPAVIFLMFLTSIGCFGYLSKAHNDQSLIRGDISAKLAVFDEKIKIRKENIESSRKLLKQLDDAVDQLMSRSKDERGIDKSVTLRRSQAKDRARLLKEITEDQQEISKINEERSIIASEVRKVENETGPIKYIAALIYGDNPDINLLESTVRIVIIMIVAVFDPLALVLILAAQQSIRWAKDESLKNKIDKRKAPTLSNHESDIIVNTSADIKSSPEMHIFESLEKQEEKVVDNKSDDFDISKHAYLFKGGFGFKEHVPMVANMSETKQTEIEKSDKIDSFDIDNYLNNKVRINNSFGSQLPKHATRGDIFVKIDSLPHSLHKWDGSRWISIAKSSTDSYLSDLNYIEFLSQLLNNKKYDIEMLSEPEKDAIRAYEAYLHETNKK